MMQRLITGIRRKSHTMMKRNVRSYSPIRGLFATVWKLMRLSRMRKPMSECKRRGKILRTICGHLLIINLKSIILPVSPKSQVRRWFRNSWARVSNKKASVLSVQRFVMPLCKPRAWSVITSRRALNIPIINQRHKWMLSFLEAAFLFWARNSSITSEKNHHFYI